ncbi:restriction endonuclease [Lysobacter arvi]|uniref:Restriction endonuclease n=1 Tax=Lysobacter arvi TaxID=3038776 RepID=A0ABU1C9A4_9GAMM|nr:restriction endonuclease [Lysobacter arvi]MDR0181675.1 restriction endonuclease [Lysobacter arvi]
MLAGFSLTIALVVTVVLGAAATAWLWLVRRRQGETTAGIEALADMRWREFSRLVVEALQRRGFEAESVESTLERGPQAELRLKRDGRTWLLSCKLAGARSRLGVASVRELADAVRFNGAAGGLLATPARIDADARKAGEALELFDGNALWALVGPMLPASLRDDLTLNVRRRSVRETAIAWIGALVVGVALGFVVPAITSETRTEPAPGVEAPSATSPAAPTAVSPAPAVADPALSAPADPNRDRFERGEVIHAVAALPWVERVLWSTSSTLVIQQRQDVDQLQVQEVCGVLARYDALRASRLQLQPPAGSERKVRFLQCRAY